jgi:hypothetical protein
MVNYINSRPIEPRLFSALFSAMEAAHTQLLLHTEVRWLSRGRVLSTFCELREGLINLFMSKESELADLLSNETWCNKTAFLADISKSMQGKNKNILICTEKVALLRKK